MTEWEAEKAVQRLNRVRSQIQWWRAGTTGLLALGAIASITSIYASVRGLTQPGPRQDDFTRELTQGLQERTLPQVQTIATQTLTEIRPQVEQEFRKAEQRLPEITGLAMDELQTLQHNVTANGEKTVEASLMPMLEKKEQKIRQMFPDATDENVKAVTATLADEGKMRAVQIADRLFARHTAALNNIVTHMETIAQSEKPAASDEQAGWEIGLAALDVVRDDLRVLEPKSNSTGVGQPKTAIASATPAKEVTR